MRERYRINLLPRAQKDLDDLAPLMKERVIAALQRLRVEPFSANSQRLKGSRDLFRLRVGDYRIIYTIAHQMKLIEIAKVQHHRDVYRGLND
ncbi:MAG: type II toxin-antitoxin system RelE/ParE family toxin [Dehalococcoidia bacterium]|nr:type II toxin-antitoxin system RelE/ParE family toxin [Dehalococcoidia bacterium]